MKSLFTLLIFFIGFWSIQCVSKVIELSDRFLELRGETEWMIMFYAPWCGHCKKMEPEWGQVAQKLYGTEIRVGRVDCTRFTGMATSFRVKGFPTIMYVKGDTQHVYRGDRAHEEIVGFALRMSLPTVPHLDSSELKEKKKEGVPFFLYGGPLNGELWDLYYEQAEIYRQYHFFYSTDKANLKAIGLKTEEASIFIVKDERKFEFDIPEDTDVLNNTLAFWINDERFSVFEKVTHGSLSQLWQANKYLVIAVVKELKTGNISKSHQRFRSLIEDVAKSNYDYYHDIFQFGWTGSPDIANSIAMERLILPTLLVLNTSSMEYYFPETDPLEMDGAAVKAFLSTIADQVATAFGGDTYFVRVYRAYYNARTSLEDMWSGNPVLTAVLFGLPLGFLSLICYSIWCSDILDANEEEEDESHEKKE